MGLTSNNCELIKAVAENNLALAKRAAIASCVEDNTAKNKAFTQRYERILASNSTSFVMQQIPSNLQYKLTGALPEDFNKEQYYLSEREKEIFNKIYRMKVTAEKMQELGISYRNTTLLYGESGTGKTLFGKYVAYRFQLPYFYINFSQLVGSYMGETAGNINKVFNYIKTIPCVFMIDEVDCIATHRSKGGSKGPDGELERTTISLMQELDTLPNTVVLIAATNREDLLDLALLRRFSLKHEVKPLSKDESKIMVTNYLADINKKLEKEEKKINITEEEIKKIIDNGLTPASIMLSVIQRIGEQLYEMVETEIPENPWVEEEKQLSEEAPVYAVTFSQTYKVVSTEGKEGAVRKARDLKLNSYQSSREPETIDVRRV